MENYILHFRTASRERVIELVEQSGGVTKDNRRWVIEGEANDVVYIDLFSGAELLREYEEDETIRLRRKLGGEPTTCLSLHFRTHDQAFRLIAHCLATESGVVDDNSGGLKGPEQLKGWVSP